MTVAVQIDGSAERGRFRALQGAPPRQAAPELLDEEKAHHPVSRLALLLGVSRQGYYKHTRRAHDGPGPRERADTDLAARIRAHHARSRGTYGAPRIQADLRALDGLRAGRNSITRLMRREGLTGTHRRTGLMGFGSGVEAGFLPDRSGS
ncbi:helix-turn-helix protein [Murinocardiopsis flavida]|uniref:Helix-turn-helix protein n=1 Tax=Murinocardiopsis flavida TaxID=645275 RepID=A0A2P8CRC6_9ACTN|nr:IS3 family transposase [Murinocardiopsis flavida]PSK87502.1 helix-turn-helix protein [Murinocardiopsis flavida]